jgi:hypothetical protein
VILLIVARLSGSQGEICYEAKPDHENCAQYNLAALLLIEAAKLLNDYGVALTAIATVAVALFTWTLWQSNEKMWGVTKIAADAARKSADASFAAERARFFIIIEHHNLKEIIANVESRGNLADGENFSIRYRLQNYGKTPGIIRELTLDSMIATDPVDPPSHFLVIKEFAERMIGANGSTEPDWYSPTTSPHLSQVQAIGRNHARLYDDVFGNHQVHKFYLRSNRIIGGDCILQPFDYKDHNQST